MSQSSKQPGKTGNAKTPKAPETATDQVKEALSNVSAKIVDGVDKVKTTAVDTAAIVRDQYDHLGENARDAYDRVRGSGAEMIEEFETRVRERPVQSLLIAAGAGFVLGIVSRLGR